MIVSTDTEIGPAVGHLQTDTFCAHCGYNLVTQAVLRDSRLEILVVRCPECGRFTAAGQGTSAAKVWLNRFATVMLGNYVLFLIVVFCAVTFFMGMIAYGHVTAFTEMRQDPTPLVQGRIVSYT